MQRGQEQDSHEALRVLLDGLETEEEKRLRLDAGTNLAGDRHLSIAALVYSAITSSLAWWLIA